MGAIKKVFAITTKNNYYKFKARCSREGYSMGEALTAIVHRFANSKDISLPKKVNKEPEHGHDTATETPNMQTRDRSSNNSVSQVREEGELPEMRMQTKCSEAEFKTEATEVKDD